MKGQFSNDIKLSPVFHLLLFGPCKVCGLWINMLWTLCLRRLKTGGNYFLSLCRLSFFFPPIFVFFIFFFVIFCLQFWLFLFFLAFPSFLSFRTHYISDVSSSIMKLYNHLHIYIIHIMLPVDLYIHESQFCNRNHGNIFCNKSRPNPGSL
jgi:hypothetical protein